MRNSLVIVFFLFIKENEKEENYKDEKNEEKIEKFWEFWIIRDLSF